VRIMQSFAPELYLFGSGSARAARKLLMRSTAHPGKTGPISTAEFRFALAALDGVSPAALVDLGVEPARAETVLVAAEIMLAILDQAGAERALVSGCGLRNGVAREMWRSMTRESAIFRRDALLDAGVGGLGRRASSAAG